MGILVKDSALSTTKVVDSVAKRQKIESQSSGSLCVVPRARDVGQKSVFDMGVTVDEHRSDGRVFKLTEHQFNEPQAKAFVCSFAGCNRRFARRCHLVHHENSHKGSVTKPRSITEMASVRALMSASQLSAALEVEMKMILWTLVDVAAERATRMGGWGKKIDGRQTNKGSSHRQGRSPAFKGRSRRNV